MITRNMSIRFKLKILVSTDSRQVEKPAACCKWKNITSQDLYEKTFYCQIRRKCLPAAEKYNPTRKMFSYIMFKEDYRKSPCELRWGKNRISSKVKITAGIIPECPTKVRRFILVPTAKEVSA